MSGTIVLTPTYLAYSAETRRSIEALTKAIRHQCRFFTCKEVYIHAARRNLLATGLTAAKKSGAEQLLWLDSDIEFSPDDFNTILADVRPGRAYTGVYFSRHGPCNPLTAFGNPRDGYRFEIPLDAASVQKRFIKVDACGLGFFAISVEDCQRYAALYDQTAWFDSSRWAPESSPPEKRTQVIGEDLDFCAKLRALGVEIYADLQVMLTHNGVGFDEYLSKAPKSSHCPVTEQFFAQEPDAEHPPITNLGITKRAVLYVGLKCNLRCKMCYYANSPGKQWRSVAECKADADRFRQKYDNAYVDITGGEPTGHPSIVEIVRYCSTIGLRPTLISNLQLLSYENHVDSLAQAGLHEVLASVHATDRYDELVQQPGAFGRVRRALKLLKERGIQLRFNCVLLDHNTSKLCEIAKMAVDHGALALNIIAWNPFYEWAKTNQQPEWQQRFSERRDELNELINFGMSAGLEVNLRYMPLCLLPNQVTSCYNFAQLPYDPGEWDFCSWLNKSSVGVPDIRQFYLEIAIQQRQQSFVYGPQCRACGLHNVCDGLSKQYADRYGFDELVPVSIPGMPPWSWARADKALLKVK